MPGDGDAELSLRARYQRSLLGVFGTPQRVLVKGQGCYLWDEDGARYLDLLGGIAVNCLGHAHPAFVSALTAQAETLGHISNFFTSVLHIELAETLLDLAQAPADSGVFLCNSGTEANEAAFKMARRTGRSRMVALTGSFHGRTMGALALTHNPGYRAPFEPLPGDVVFVEPGDVDTLERELRGGNVAAFMVEPIQGEAGVRPLSDEYLRAARDLTSRYGTLLIVDEIQTGMGRSGEWFAHSSARITPDIMTLAKGLGGGFPIGAVIAFGTAVKGLLSPGQHGTTFGGNPLAAAAALAVIDTIRRDGLLAQVRERGQRLTRGIRDLEHPLLDDVRGRGLLLGIGLTTPVAQAVAAALLDKGVVVNAPNPTTIRLAPAYVLTDADVDEFIGRFGQVLHEVEVLHEVAASTRAAGS
nr:acetylornithine transaminase [Devriesea agamarum]